MGSVPAAVWWLALPVVTTLVATVVVTLGHRPRRRRSAEDSIAGYARFRAALDAAPTADRGDAAAR